MATAEGNARMAIIRAKRAAEEKLDNARIDFIDTAGEYLRLLIDSGVPETEARQRILNRLKVLLDLQEKP